MASYDPSAVEVGENCGSPKQQPRGGMSMEWSPFDELFGIYWSRSDLGTPCDLKILLEAQHQCLLSSPL